MEPVTAAQCQLACEMASGCDSISYNTAARLCFLKSGPSPEDCMVRFCQLRRRRACRREFCFCISLLLHGCHHHLSAEKHGSTHSRGHTCCSEHVFELPCVTSRKCV